MTVMCRLVSIPLCGVIDGNTHVKGVVESLGLKSSVCCRQGLHDIAVTCCALTVSRIVVTIIYLKMCKHLHLRANHTVCFNIIDDNSC